MVGYVVQRSIIWPTSHQLWQSSLSGDGGGDGAVSGGGGENGGSGGDGGGCGGVLARTKYWGP